MEIKHKFKKYKFNTVKFLHKKFELQLNLEPKSVSLTIKRKQKTYKTTNDISQENYKKSKYKKMLSIELKKDNKKINGPTFFFSYIVKITFM